VAVFVHAHGHGGLLAAVADGLDLLHLVGPGQQVLAAFEQLAAEVGTQPIAEHRNAQLVDHLAELPDLAAAEELRLVHEHAAERPVRGQVVADQPL